MLGVEGIYGERDRGIDGGDGGEAGEGGDGGCDRVSEKDAEDMVMCGDCSCAAFEK